MNNRQYIKRIGNIRQRIRNGVLENTEKELDSLYLVKPVQLSWFIAKAEWMLKAEYPGEKIIELLNGKYSVNPEFNELEDVLQIIAKAYHSMGDQLEEQRTEYCYYKYKNLVKKENSSFLNEFEKKFRQHQAFFLENLGDGKNIRLLMEDYYIRGDWVIYRILSCILEQIDNSYEPRKDLEVKYVNGGYLKERLLDEESPDCIVSAEYGQNMEDYEVLINALLLLGKRVHFISLPVQYELKGDIDLSETLNISLENMEYHENLMIYYPIEVNNDTINVGDNRDFLIRHITEKLGSGDLKLLFCKGSLFDELSGREILRKHTERLSEGFQHDIYDGMAEMAEDCFAFGWSGNYLTYIGQIYGFDVKEYLMRPRECLFSIVIPVKDSTTTLEYTLKTCLNQRYDGKYEIVISDNSVEGNSAVYDLCSELNDPRIHYYKTPRPLVLTKSFEYAYLQAKGEFILSIGADDGLLPWALDKLSEIIDKYPDEDIIQWDRGFYAWPGFNKGQQNQFIIPASYKKDSIPTEYITGRQYSEEIMCHPEYVYCLPMLYINSGFRHRYMKKLLNKTGSLWNGNCQDIAMGVVNILINHAILKVEYPFTIAGMSSNSMGATSVSAIDDKRFKKHLQEFDFQSSAGCYVVSDTEFKVPYVRQDKMALYRSFLRAAKKGLCDTSFIEKMFDWKGIFSKIGKSLSLLDPQYDYEMRLVKNAVRKQGKDLTRWFEEEIYKPAMIPKLIDQKKVKELESRKLYEEGQTANGGEVLDASKFNVSDIWGAVLLFEERTGL